MKGDPVEHRVAVIHRDQHLGQLVLVVRRNDHRKGRDEQRVTDIVFLVGIDNRRAYGGISEAVIGLVEPDARRLVVGRSRPACGRRLCTVDFRGRHIRRMQAGGMRRIDRSFQHLRPVARRVYFDDGNLVVRRMRPGRWFKLGDVFRIAHPQPHEPAGFPGGVGFQLGLGLERLARIGLARHIHHIAVHVEFPAVIETAQTAILVPAEGERRTAMAAEFIDRAETALCIAEHDQVFTQQAHTGRFTIAFGHFFRHAGRNPVLAHNAAHRRGGFDKAQKVVFFPGNHDASPVWFIAPACHFLGYEEYSLETKNIVLTSQVGYHCLIIFRVV